MQFRPDPSSLPPILAGLRALAPVFDAYLVDQWGVLHDGHAPHPGAIDALRKLKAHGTVILLSNTSRRLGPATETLRALGFSDDCYDRMVTAGELAAEYLADLGRRLGRTIRVHGVLGPSSTDGLIDDLDAVTVEAQDADVLVAASITTLPVSTWDPTFRAAIASGIPMVCANPDVQSIQPDGSFVWCGGALAERFAHLGGTVVRFGKPWPEVYEAACRDLPLGTRVVAFGDSMAHDICGARRNGVAGVLISRGIHAPELGIRPGERPEAHAIEMLEKRHDVVVDAVLPAFVW